MNLREFYEEVGGDYDKIVKRLHTEERIRKYLNQFQDYHYDEKIQKDLEEKDYEAAFLDVHTLKGMCASLNLDALGTVVSVLTEELRGGKPAEGLEPKVKAVLTEYERTVSALRRLKEE